MAAWGDAAAFASEAPASGAPGEAAVSESPPARTPLVASPGFDGVLGDASVRGTGGAAVLDDEQQAAVVRSLLLGELTNEEACAVHRVSREQLTQWIRRHRRTVRRGIEEQIGSVLTSQGLEKDDFVLSGNLESMSLSDLLETVQLGRKNAHVRVESGAEVGEVWCTDGDVIDARVGDLVGSPAVYRLLELTEGKLQAEFSSAERERTILASTETLLIEFARRADERKRLSDQIGDLHGVYVPGDAALTASLEPRRRELLQAFDGQRSVQDVLTASSRPELDTLAVIASLLAQKQLVPQTTPRRSERPAAAAPVLNRAVMQPGYASLFPSSGSPATLPSASLTDPTLAPPSEALSARGGAAISVPPILPSVALLQAMPALARRAAPFVFGSGALVFAFAIGLWSARSPAPARQQQPEPAPSSSASNLSEALCGPGMALFTPEGGASAEQRPFCLAQRSVRTAEYQACVDSQHCTPPQADAIPAPGEPLDGKARCNAGQPGREQLPMNCVTQRQAEQYCEWRGQRLPLPAEWELAWQASRGTQPRASMSFEAAGLDSPLGELAEWTRERTPQALPQPVAATAPAQPEPTAQPEQPARAEPTAQAEAPTRPEAQAEPTAEAPTTGASTTPDRIDVIANEPSPPAFAVLRAPPPSTASGDTRPKRLYTSASAQGRGIGFRCAASLEATR